jgi:hypothetical protein
MFEPQDHPNVFPVPGGPPTPPYDVAGWTLAFQMGVAFDRILQPFDGPFERVADWNLRPPAGTIRPLSVTTVKPAGLIVRPRQNDGATAINRFLAAGDRVRRLADGSMYVQLGPGTRERAMKAAADLGVSFSESVDPGTLAVDVSRPRIGLWDQYGGSMPSGWTRWLLEQFEFPFERVFNPALDAGNLRAKYDVLIFVSGAVPSPNPGAGRGGGGGRGGGAQAAVPAEYRNQIGPFTAEKTIPQLRAFLEAGGTVIAIGSSAANLAGHLKLPVEDHLVENGGALPRARFFVPGSVLSARVDTKHPVAAGMNERTDFFFDESPVFRITAGAPDVTPIAWFDSPEPLRSGWAWGQQYLDKGVIALEARAGRGRVLLFGPEILHRAQPHGTFKFLFNTLWIAGGR